jgi:hypothetical protein
VVQVKLKREKRRVTKRLASKREADKARLRQRQQKLVLLLQQQEQQQHQPPVEQGGDPQFVPQLVDTHEKAVFSL